MRLLEWVKKKRKDYTLFGNLGNISGAKQKMKKSSTRKQLSVYADVTASLLYDFIWI